MDHCARLACDNQLRRKGRHVARDAIIVQRSSAQLIYELALVMRVGIVATEAVHSIKWYVVPLVYVCIVTGCTGHIIAADETFAAFEQAGLIAVHIYLFVINRCV